MRLDNFVAWYAITELGIAVCVVLFNPLTDLTMPFLSTRSSDKSFEVQSLG
jgi:hypothetical protein